MMAAMEKFVILVWLEALLLLGGVEGGELWFMVSPPGGVVDLGTLLNADFTSVSCDIIFFLLYLLD